MKTINVFKMMFLFFAATAAVAIVFALLAIITGNFDIDRSIQAPASYILGCVAIEVVRAKGWFK